MPGPECKGCVAALKMAFRNNPGRDSLIHHSDRGLQYYSSAYMKVLGKKTRISMTEKGDPLENAIAERVNGILKDELLDKRFDGFREARANPGRGSHPDRNTKTKVEKLLFHHN